MSNAITFDNTQLDLIKRLYAKDCTNDEFLLFIEVAKRTGLDPFSRQIYAIKRGSKMVIQTSIDGYRLIADRGGNYAGNDEAVFFHNPEGLLIRATAKVWKFVNGQRCDFTATAVWDEYVQLDSQGKVTKMWADKPYIMLAKCAEAQALRKAFPADLSGIYTHEEMMQADVIPTTVAATSTKKRKEEPEILELIAPVTEPLNDVQGFVTKEQLALITELKKAAKFTPAEATQWSAMIQVEYNVKSPKELSQDQAESIINDLKLLGGQN